MKKQCQMCKVTKDSSEFFKSNQTKDGLFSYCKPCKVETNRNSDLKRMSENRKRFLEQRRGWHIKQKYGISLSVYKDMLNKQQGMCAICKHKPDERSLVVDHCHETEKVRGLLCDVCNRGIGMFKDSPENLKSAARYLGWY